MLYFTDMMMLISLFINPTISFEFRNLNLNSVHN